MDVPYLLRGVTPMGTDSSTLISSSKYLNHPRLRAWIGDIILKKNGPNMPAQAEMYPVVEMLREIQDLDRIEELFTEERRKNPALDAWFDRGCDVSNLSKEDYAAYPAGSFGRAVYDDVIAKNFDLVIYDLPKPRTQLDHWNIRAGQTHDLEHIVTGGDFNYLGELVPSWCKMTNQFKHLSPELAGEMSIILMFSALRYTVRTMIHYPSVWPVAQNAIERGMRVGHASDPIFLMKFEDAFPLPLDEARAALGIREAEFVDTTTPSAHWAGRMPAYA